MVAVSVMVSEGKIMASDVCGSGRRQGLVQGDKGHTRVPAQMIQGKSKNEGGFWP